MKIIKPQSLSVLHKPYTFLGRHYLSVATLGFFRLGRDNSRFLPENLQWPHVVASLPTAMALDEVMPKQHAEALLLGSAYSPQPQGSTSLQVQMRIDDGNGQPLISKCLCISGDRQWHRNLLGQRQVGSAQPFISMPITYRRAWGGPRSSVNPEGCGELSWSPLFSSDSHGAMPNIDYPENAASPAWRARVAAGFGPIALSNPGRRKKFGTYDRHWQQNDAPGFARDIDWSVFNMAPPDQWAGRVFTGGEHYLLHHLHPQHAELSGTLPTLAARAFILRQAQDVEQICAVPMQMDTVWFLPDHLLGVAIYHGTIDITDSDALDVTTLMVGYEHAQQPRSLEHYQQVMALRLDPVTAVQHAFNDSQLAAERSAADLRERAQMQQEAEAAVLARSQRRLDLLDAQYWAARGSSAPADHQPARASLPPLGIMTAQTVAEGDFDLSGLLAKAKTLADDAIRQGQEALANLVMQPAPPPDPQQLLATALEQAAVPAYDLLPAESSGIDPQVATMLAGLDQTGSAEKNAADRAAVMKIPALRRQGRRAAPKVVLPTLPYPALVATELGGQIRRWVQDGVCLAGRDLAGADLRGIDLRGADLREVMLEGADLSDACLADTNLQGAVLVGTRLDRCNFSRANLQQANLSTSQGQNICFAGADLSRVLAIDAQWHQANLQGASLQRLLAIKSLLPGAQLDRADASKANLFNVNADDSSWQEATLNKTVLLRTSLQRGNFRAARLNQAAFNGASLQQSTWDGATLESVQGGARSNWSGASMVAAIARKCGFHGADLSGLDARQGAFLRCNFGQADMQAAQLDQALFSYCSFFSADLRLVSATAAEFYQCVCRKTDFSQALLATANFAQCDRSESIAPQGVPMAAGSPL